MTCPPAHHPPLPAPRSRRCSRSGRATEGDLRAIGGRLARFHLGLAPQTSGDGTGRLAGVVEETLATLSGAAAGLVAPSRLAALARFTQAALDGFGPRLEARDAAGLVRDGHGDLRAEHILLGDQMEMVDAVDFDPTLRVADVAYDLAFLVMDVARRDEGLARALVRGYTAGGGDAGDERLLAFLVVVRRSCGPRSTCCAPIGSRARHRDERVQRASGSSRSPSDSRGAPACRCRLRRGPRRQWEVDARRGAELRVGAPGVLIRPCPQDELPARADDRAAQAIYDREVSREVYDALGRAAAAATRTDGGAIVDATFRHPDDVAAFQATSSAADRAEWIVCHAPAEVLLVERARRRTGSGEHGGRRRPRARRRTDPPRRRTPAAPSPTAGRARHRHRASPQLLDELAGALDARLVRRS